MLDLLKKLSTLLSDYQLAYIMFIIKNRYIPNFKKPRSLNEKINYIKLYNRNPLREMIVDRLKVREYIQKKSSECLLPKIHWSGIEFSKEIWNKLPNQFVIKANHGSKMIEIVDKREDSYEELKSKTIKWLKKDYSKFGREWIYENLEKYLIVEEKLELNGDIPPDFKFFVCSGKVEMVQLDLDRFSTHARNIYTRDFKLMDATLFHNNSTEIVEKPKCYDKALLIAEELAIDFDFIRADLYLIDDKVYFGELTNTPGNGFEKFNPIALDFDLGSKLPTKINR